MAYIKKTWKDYPDATTQIKAEYLNNIENGIEAVDAGLENIENGIENIENAINQLGKYLTATAGSNADYSIALQGTLSSGDAVNIFFPAPANGTSDARLSVNGGSNYYNIQYDGANLIGNNVRGKYLTLVFNGTIIEALGFKSNIIGVLSANVTAGNSNPIKLSLSQKTRFGTKFSIRNDGILIPAGVTKVLVSAQTYFSSTGGNDIHKAMVFIGSISANVDALLNISTSYNTISIPPVIIDVEPGDILYLYSQGVANDVWNGNGSAQYNRLFVEEVI